MRKSQLLALCLYYRMLHMSIRKNITIILLFIFAVANGKEYRFEHLGVEHGLSDLTVRSIYQDEINRIWIATYDGLNCYDGNKVRDFRQQIGEVHDVNIHSITRICGNQKGVMYLYSAAGIVEFNLKTERMRIIYEKPVTAFFYHEGFLWFAAENVIKKYDTTADKITSNYKLPYTIVR